MPDTTTETATAVDSAHQPEPWYWEAGSSKCPHGTEPDDNTPERDAWEDATSERHQPSGQGVTICLDAPAGDVCEECSNDVGEAVPWSACETRRHAQPKLGITPTPDAHEPVEVWVGTGDCLERECEDYFTEDGDEIPSKERCSHIGVELICGGCSTRNADGYYEPTVPWAGPHPAPAPSAA
ncbi:MAG TPA: hypothetical protein VGL02_07970 [Streptomyces sp.]